MPSDDVEIQIQAHQRAILQQLIELCPKDRRVEATRLVDQFWRWSKALTDAALSPTNLSRYATKEAIDAIRAFLEDLGRPAEFQEIIYGVVSRGFRRGSTEKQSRANVKRSLEMHVPGGQGHHKRGLKQMGDLVGLPEWDNSRFMPSASKLTLTDR